MKKPAKKPSAASAYNASVALAAARENAYINKQWRKFCTSGLFHFVNCFLLMFHWELALTKDAAGNYTCMPRMCSHSGFSEASNHKAYSRIWKLLSSRKQSCLR